MKHISIILILSVFSALVFSACVNSESGIKKNKNGSIQLVMAEINSLNSIAGKTDLEFKKKVEELSGGKIKINLLSNGLLGSEDSVLDLMQSRNSSIQLARVSTASLTFRGTKKSALLTLPYTFRNAEHFWHFAESPLSKQFLDEPSDLELGLKGLYFGTEGFRSFYSSTDIKSPEDFEGLRIRITTDPVLIKFARALKVEPVFFDTNDTYAALQTGKVEIAEQPVVNYYVNSLYDVAPYFILDEHTMGVTEVLITTKAWESLNKKQQQILEEAGKYASSYCRQIAKSSEEFAVKAILANGVKITEINDKSPWKELSSRISYEYAENYLPLYNEILSIE